MQEAARLVRTLRSAGRDAKPVAVLVLPSDVELAANTTAFQRVIPYQPKRHVRDGMDAFARTDHERFNILPRLRAVDYAPWAEFIMLDTDVLCSAPTDGVWAAFRRSGQAVAAPGLAVDCKWHFGTVCDVSKVRILAAFGNRSSRQTITQSCLNPSEVGCHISLKSIDWY